MPARRTPQLSHHSVEYKAVSERFHEELLARQGHILRLVGFFEEFGEPADLAYTGEEAAADLVAELSGILTDALVIRIDAGYKAPSKVVATLTAIIKDPKLALAEGTEPEARGALAAAYQRQDESPGTFWFDIYEPGLGQEPEDGRVRLAAEKALGGLKAEAARGRPIAHDIRYLTQRLREIFLRFNDKITRRTVWSSHGDGDLYQTEKGRFFEFVEEVLRPLHSFLRDLPCGSDVLVPELSADYIARQAVTLKPVQRVDAHLSP